MQNANIGWKRLSVASTSNFQNGFTGKAKLKLGIIFLVRTKTFPKTHTFIPDDQTYVCVSLMKKCKFFKQFYVRTKWMIPQ